MNYQHDQLATLFGGPVIGGRFKHRPEDFVVEEILSFEPSGAGEHHFLWVEKCNANTGFVAQDIAKRLGVHPKYVAWAGLKDRFALTRQWFSVHKPGVEQLEALKPTTQYRVLHTTRHNRKLRIGANRGNAFQIVLRNCVGELERLEKRLEDISERGVPNYFGLQRFGRNLSNLERAHSYLIEGKRLKKTDRSMAISALRSAVFNQLLSAAVEGGFWQSVGVGDTVMLSGSHSVFKLAEEDYTSVQQRVSDGDCAATLPLLGEYADGSLPEREISALAEFQPWLEALSAQRVKMARRPQVLQPKLLAWHWLEKDALSLSFELPSGGFATSVLRELVRAEGL